LDSFFYTEYYDKFIINILKNNPSYLNKYIKSLLTKKSTTEKDENKKMKIIEDLLDLSNQSQYIIRNECMRNSIYPSLCLQISIKLNDIFVFLLSIVKDSRNFIWSFLKKSKNLVKDIINIDNINCPEIFMKAICCISIYIPETFENEEDIINFVNNALVKYTSKRSIEILQFFLFLQKNLKIEDFEYYMMKIIEVCDFTDQILLFATFCHTEQYEKIIEYIEKSLAVTDIHIEKIHQLCNLYMNKIINVNFLLRFIMERKPGQQKDDVFILNCVYNMLKSKLFKKENIDPSDW
jgi:hypothetical protein